MQLNLWFEQGQSHRNQGFRIKKMLSSLLFSQESTFCVSFVPLASNYLRFLQCVLGCLRMSLVSELVLAQTVISCFFETLYDRVDSLLKVSGLTLLRFAYGSHRRDSQGLLHVHIMLCFWTTWLFIHNWSSSTPYPCPYSVKSPWLPYQSPSSSD